MSLQYGDAGGLVDTRIRYDIHRQFDIEVYRNYDAISITKYLVETFVP